MRFVCAIEMSKGRRKEGGCPPFVVNGREREREKGANKVGPVWETFELSGNMG